MLLEVDKPMSLDAVDVLGRFSGEADLYLSR